MLLTFNHDMISIDGVALDCVVQSISVSGSLIFSDGQTDALSGTKRVPMGWDDADIRISADLLTDEDGGLDCYERLEKIERIFKSLKTPKVFDVVNRHLAARGVRRVVFSSFDSQESSEEDVISINIAFTEHEPAMLKAEEGTGIKSTSEKTISTPKTDEDNPAIQQELMVDVAP